MNDGRKTINDMRREAGKEQKKWRERLNDGRCESGHRKLWKKLFLSPTGLDCTNKSLTTLWKRHYKETKHFSLPFTVCRCVYQGCHCGEMFQSGDNTSVTARKRSRNSLCGCDRVAFLFYKQFLINKRLRSRWLLHPPSPCPFTGCCTLSLRMK